jgi:5-methyltetrahydropteroyltriglutamate--homocysteine methyltransferase
MWAATGGYEAISKRSSRARNLDRLLLETTGPRRHLRAARRRASEPAGRTGARDDEGRDARGIDDLVARVQEATRYVPLERLAVSPQCGFASGVIGTMTAAQQEAKLRLIGDVARRVWGSATDSDHRAGS